MSDWLKAHDVRTPNPLFDSVRKAYRFLHRSQFWTEDEIRAYQLERVRAAYAGAKKHVAFFRDLYAGFDEQIETWDDFSSLPITYRRSLPAEVGLRRAEVLPAGMEEARHTATSGSTGHVLQVIPTNASETFRSGVAIRELEWGEVDPAWNALIIRALRRPGEDLFEEVRNGVMTHSWEPGIPQGMVKTGKGFYIDVTTTTEKIAAFMDAVAPDLIVANPSALAEAAQLLPKNSPARKSVKLIRCIGDTLDDAFRESLLTVFNAVLQDHYSSAESNAMATTAPDGSGLLVHDENVLVELLHDDGTPCGHEEVGRIVITNLQPYATPFIRYDIADMAVRGVCSGSFGLSRLKKIIGRKMALVRTPDDKRMHLSTVFMALHKVRGIRGVQIRQFSLTEFELVLTLLPDAPASAANEACELLRKFFDQPIEVRAKVVNDLPRTEAGKIQKYEWLGDAAPT